ncbi:class F sortase [Actinoplanes subglobosus]|uniref:Class F sortase n=1 Tax=Actinoplanes subglobosus TaxID=1547892 RepID=A0ABV8J0Y2_9ACTN
MSIRRAVLITVLGTALTTASTVAACRSSTSDDFGTPPAASSAPTPVVAGTVPSTAPTVAPARLRIPAVGLDAVVEAVGVDTGTGEFAVPADVDRVGWYRFGPGYNASAGSIVIAGHVDAADQGKGAFFRLGELESGDEVTLVGPGGRERTFEVTARKRYRKTAVPLDEYFARDGVVRLTLITCGGPFDTRTRHYRDNVVVTAVTA